MITIWRKLEPFNKRWVDGDDKSRVFEASRPVKDPTFQTAIPTRIPTHPTQPLKKDE
jgi:hypothetical protein